MGDCCSKCITAKTEGNEIELTRFSFIKNFSVKKLKRRDKTKKPNQVKSEKNESSKKLFNKNPYKLQTDSVNTTPSLENDKTRNSQSSLPELDDISINFKEDPGSLNVNEFKLEMIRSLKKLRILQDELYDAKKLQIIELFKKLLGLDDNDNIENILLSPRVDVLLGEFHNLDYETNDTITYRKSYPVRSIRVLS
jgi:hypothetical protein